MKTRSLYVILIITLTLLLLSIGSYYFLKKNDNLKFSAKVIEAFPSIAIIRPLDKDLLEKYDAISIDIPNNALNIKVSEEEMEKRRANWEPVVKEVSGYLARYRELVTSGNRGAILELKN